MDAMSLTWDAIHNTLSHNGSGPLPRVILAPGFVFERHESTGGKRPAAALLHSVQRKIKEVKIKPKIEDKSEIVNVINCCNLAM